MRISDWSSDVCSSDLEGSRADSAFRLEIGRTGSSSGGSAHGGVGGARRGGDRRGARGLAVRPRGQIGRASCRERVCQYVSISVVAVSLKKKITHIHIIIHTTLCNTT